MSLARNAVITTVVTALLIGSLVFLFPSAGAANAEGATLAPTGISSVKCIRTEGTTPAGQCDSLTTTLRLDFQVANDKIPAGSDANARALAFANGITINADKPDGAGGFTPVSCTTTPAARTIKSSVLRTIESGNQANAYGISTDGGTTYQDFMGVYVTLEVTGCTFFTSSTPAEQSFRFTATQGSVAVAQTKTLPNPITALAKDTAAKEPINNDAPTSTTAAPTQSYALQTTNGGPIPASGQPLTAAKTPSATVTPKLINDPAKQVRSGTEINVEEVPTKAGSLGAPSFGIQPKGTNGLDSVTTQDPIGFIRVTANDPVDGDIPPGNVIGSMDVTVCTTVSKMTARSMTNTDQLLLKAFNSAGELKDPSEQPTRVGSSVKVGAGTKGADVALAGLPGTDAVCADFTISHFSSFAIVAAKVTTSGGGGGGGGGVSDSADFDFDGLTNGWETQYCGNYWSCNADDDLDGDGLTNLEEFTLGTDPTNADTDGDGVSDGQEVLDGTDPLNAPVVTPPTEPITDTNETTEPTTEEDGGNQKKTPGFEAIALIAALGAAFVAFRRK